MKKDVPLSIDVKDKDLPLAATKTIDLIRKYDRFHSTVVGSDSGKSTTKMLKYDNRICTFMGASDLKWLIIGYFTGLLPYFAIDRDLAALPYMTREYI